MIEVGYERSPKKHREVAIAGQPLSYYLAGTSEQTEVAAHRLGAHMASMKGFLTRLEALVVPERLSVVTKLAAELEGFSAQVSLIGQVKAGKTKLTSAITGMPGVLPSDVNPWTSVVTSIHVNTPKPHGSNAVFTFYTNKDWAGLTESGGQLGKLAQRADFAAELDEMREQVRAMQARTEARLGANFGLLLGAQHRFKGFNSELLEKYVCLGEEPRVGETSGRYADVTKAADLYVDSTEIVLPTTISDTPGVNDPFLAREHATLAKLAKTDICVIVLSAHQAFSTVDLALMRVLLAMKAEQIILFVNRVDELADPDTQIREIDDFVRGILKSKGIKTRIPIIYGSATWADLALRGEDAEVSPASVGRLMLLSEARAMRARNSPTSGRLLLGQPPYSTHKVRDLSGLYELRNLVAHMSVMNAGAPFAADVLVRAIDVANQSALLLTQTLEGDLPLKPDLNMHEILLRLNRVLQGLEVDFPQTASAISDRMMMKMSTAFREFIERESVRIHQAFASGEKMNNWAPDTETLRVDINSAYHSFAAEMTSDISFLYERTAHTTGAIYADILEGESQLFSVRAPRAIEPKVPATLMRTMSFDLKTSWLGGWLARATGPGPMVKRFEDLVTAEMVSFLDELSNQHVFEYVNQARQILHGFLTDHLETVQSFVLLDGSTRNEQMRQRLGIEVEVKRRLVSLKGLVSELQAQVASVCTDFRLALK